MICMILRSWRLYSWSLLICTSKRELQSTSTLAVSRIISASLSLFSFFIARNFFWNFLSSAYFSSSINELRSVIHASPIFSLISSDNNGFDFSSHLRCVTPFVLLLNFSGHSLKKSGNRKDLRSPEWIAATPFTEWLPTIDRFAMRTCFVLPSSINDILVTASGSSGKAV